MESGDKPSSSWMALVTGFFSFAIMMARVYLVREKSLPAITQEEVKGAKNMQTVAITLNVPQAEKDLIDVALVAIKDLKAQKSTQLVADALPSIIKIAGELAELMSELKSKNSYAALAYLAQQLIGV